MRTKQSLFTPTQLMFDELFVGTLIYAVVLGFFNDYTDMVDAKSFSTIFFAAFVLEVLTYLVFLLKKRVVIAFKGKKHWLGRVGLVFSVWLILFLSKFFFVWVIDQIFGNNINIYGFFGIFFVALSATMFMRLAAYIFAKLGNEA